MPLGLFLSFLFPFINCCLSLPPKKEMTWSVLTLHCSYVCALFLFISYIFLKILSDLKKLLSPLINTQCIAKIEPCFSCFWGTTVKNTNHHNVSNWRCFLFFFFSNLALNLEMRLFALQDLIARLKMFQSQWTMGAQQLLYHSCFHTVKILLSPGSCQ